MNENQVPSASASAVKAESYYQRHIFFCLNERKNGEESCSQHHAQEGFDRCKSQVKAAGLPEKWKSWSELIPEGNWLAILYTGLKKP